MQIIQFQLNYTAKHIVIYINNHRRVVYDVYGMEDKKTDALVFLIFRVFVYVYEVADICGGTSPGKTMVHKS